MAGRATPCLAGCAGLFLPTKGNKRMKKMGGFSFFFYMGESASPFLVGFMQRILIVLLSLNMTRAKETCLVVYL
jgi:hypothetical protein